MWIVLLSIFALANDADILSSRELLRDLWIAGDEQAWLDEADRHLAELDAGNPNLALQYAVVLDRRWGATHGEQALLAASLAESHAHLWPEDIRADKLKRLQQLRVSVTQHQWADAAHRSSHNPDNREWAEKAEHYRRMAQQASDN